MAAFATEKDLPREQQLEQEVAELRSALKVAQVDLAAARSHMQQFQEISQANETALSALNATHDQYKTETEAQISKNELEYKALQDKLRSVEDDVRQSANKSLNFNARLSRSGWFGPNDKKTLEDTIVDLSTSERLLRPTAPLARVKSASRRKGRLYSREVIVHAESIKTIETLKQQLSVAQATSRENLSEAANAQAKLAASEGSWKQQKEALDKEIADLNARMLFFINISRQSAPKLRAYVRLRTPLLPRGTAGDADVGGDVDTKVSELRSVVAYLRKEKEIVDLQLELSKQENVRLKAQIEHLTQSLQETRATLAEERERAMEAATSDAQHAEMLERINQFNILRESNATLRADCETYAKRSRELDVKLQALSAELEPAKEQARVVQAELQARDAQITRLEGESRRWQERNAQLLSKYDRTDPAEIQTLKDEIETLKTQKADAEKLAAEREEQANTIQARLSRLEANFRIHKDNNTKNVEKFKSSLGLLNSEKSQLNATVSELEGKIKTLTAERDALRTTSAPDASQQLIPQLETLRQEKATLEQALASERAAKAQAPAEGSLDQAALIASLKEERDRLLAEKEALSKAGSSTLLSDTARSWESEKLELVKARDEALARASTVDDLAKKAFDDVRNLRQSNDKFQARIQEMHKAREKFNSEQAATVAAAVEKAKSEITAGGASVNTEELSKKHTQELEVLRAQLTAQHEAALKAAVDTATKAAKAESTTSSSDESTKAAITAAIAAHDAELQAQRNAELDAAVERGRLESQAKSKIKDAQLVRSQVKLKDLEAQVLEWRKAGLIPEAPPPQTPTASTSKVPPSTTTAASTSQPATVSTQSTTAPSAIPVKPAAAAPAGQPAATAGEKLPTSGAVSLGVPRGGRGRGAPRSTGRGISIRGAAPSRGGAPPPAATTSGTTGVSIIGAASKRSREEDLAADDSLAKRLKPAAEPTTAPKPLLLSAARLHHSWTCSSVVQTCIRILSWLYILYQYFTCRFTIIITSCSSYVFWSCR
ncbi:hypothetical protein EDB19DRAFT_2046239 [Suillus lakei]|nr:hypothetical protein EDB19DRAFT_2046239 [Suillus lakei]